jgi:hypothetical protein
MTSIDFAICFLIYVCVGFEICWLCSTSERSSPSDGGCWMDGIICIKICLCLYK